MTDAATPGFADRLLGRARGEPTPLRPKLAPFYAPVPETPEPMLEDPVPTAVPTAVRTEAPPGRVPPADAAPEAPRQREPIERRSEPPRPTKAEPAPLIPAPPAPALADTPAPPVTRRDEPVQRASGEGVAPLLVPPAGPVNRVADPAPAVQQSVPALSPPKAPPQPDIAAALALALARLTGPTAAPPERLMPPEPPPAEAEAPAPRNMPRRDGPEPAPVHIHIGEIVVAADPPPAPPPAAPKRTEWSPVLTLDAYRASRQRGPR